MIRVSAKTDAGKMITGTLPAGSYNDALSTAQSLAQSSNAKIISITLKIVGGDKSLKMSDARKRGEKKADETKPTPRKR